MEIFYKKEEVIKRFWIVAWKLVIEEIFKDNSIKIRFGFKKKLFLENERDINFALSERKRKSKTILIGLGG